jgi:cytosine deaminase
MDVFTIANATLLDRDGRWSIEIAGETISAVRRATAQGPNRSAAAAPNVLDVGGGLVTPALVDAHLHLDLAYSRALVPENRSGTLLEAIALWSAAKAELSAENVHRRAVAAIDAEVSFGTGHIRSHVDVASSAGLRLCEGVLAAREETCGRCHVQFVAFPQDGLLRDAGALDNMRSALRMGVELVGGIPHIERTPRDGAAHLEQVFDLAAQLDRDIDVHIDETDDPSSRYTELLAAMTIERGWQGRVTASHACALASYDDVHAARVIDLLVEARVNVVCNPGVNLHLQGRFDRYPKRRGLTRIRELLARGVQCAAGQDCIDDPFYPLGNGQLLDQAFLLVHADHLGAPPQLRQAFDLVCGMAGRVIGLRRHDVAVGATADFCVFPAAVAADLVRLRPRPRCVLHRGSVLINEG